MLCQQGKRDLNTGRDAKRKCLRFWTAAHWEYHFWHLFHAVLLFRCSLLTWQHQYYWRGQQEEKRTWTVSVDKGQWGTISEATVGRSGVIVSPWRAERKRKALEGQGITVIAIYWRWGLFSLEREARHVLNKLSCLGNDTVLYRSFSSLFNLKRDCEKTQSIRTNLNHLFDHLANCKHCLWENNLSSE